MMFKTQMAEFLLKRIGGKAETIRGHYDDEIADMLCDDIDGYITMLKDIIQEVIVP